MQRALLLHKYLVIYCHNTLPPLAFFGTIVELHLQVYFPLKQKLQRLQKKVGDINWLAYVQQISDNNISLGILPLDVNRYTELLLSVCSTYNKFLAISMKDKQSDHAKIDGEDIDDNTIMHSKLMLISQKT
jgi:hypothetical protein